MLCPSAQTITFLYIKTPCVKTLDLTVEYTFQLEAYI